jgi:protein phosphatase
VTTLVVIVAAVLGAGGYFGYQWTQDQFYVGASGGELVVFRGVDAQVGPLSLNKVAYTDHVKLSSLSAVQQDQIHSGIPVDTLQAGITTLKGFTTATADTDTPPQDAGATPTPSRSAK